MSEAVLARLHALADKAADETVDPATFAGELSDVLGDEVLSRVFSVPELAYSQGRLWGEEIELERARALTAALGALADDDPRMSWVRAGIVAEAGDLEAAEAILARPPAMERSDATATTVLLARLKMRRGHLADALELLDDRCREDPDDDALQRTRAEALTEAWAELQVDRVGEQCPCGLGEEWELCCEIRLEAFLARFADRSTMYRLRQAVADHVASDPELASWEEERLAEWLGVVRECAGLGPF